MTKYYRKELENQPVFIFGHPMRFDFLATEDVVLISELDKCAARGIGGVISITRELYEEEVKKKELEMSNGNSKPHPSTPHRQEILSPNLDGRRVAEVVANPRGSRGMFARPQTGDRQGWPPQNRQGGDDRHGPMPDPIQIPSPAQFAPPPTAKINPNELK